jgi:hypothetical protein
LYEVAQNFEVLSNIHTETKNSTVAVDVLFKAFPMVHAELQIQSGRTVPLRFTFLKTRITMKVKTFKI